MRLSIIIPAYNCEDTIKNCLESIFNSEYKDFEVILVNDGSKDSTLKKIRGYNCRLIDLKDNKGVSYARNIGAKHAKGKLLVFIDSDVLIHKNTLANMIKVYDSEGTIKIINGSDSGRVLSNKLGEKFVTLKQHYSYKWKKNEIKKKYSCLQTACCLIEKKVFNEIGGFDTKYKKAGGEEYEIYHRLFKKGYKSYVYSNILYDHYHDGIKRRLSKLLIRSSLHVPFLLQRKEFESDGATGTALEAIKSIFTFLGFISLPLIFISTKLILISFLFFMCVLILNLDFLIYLIKKQSIFFSFISFFFLVSTYLTISIGISLGVLKYIKDGANND